MSCLKVTTPAFIRFLEWAREDLKSDLAIHFIAEYLNKNYDDKLIDMAALNETAKYIQSLYK